MEKRELDDTIHEQLLAEAPRQFPRESYLRLLETGLSSEMALKLLGWTGEEASKWEPPNLDPCEDS